MNYVAIESVENFTLSLESIDERIAMEAGMISSITNMISDLVPNMIFGAKKIYNHFVKLEKPDLRLLMVDERKLKRALNPNSFADLSNIEIAMPEGFSGNTLTLFNCIKENVQYVNNAPPRLQDYIKFISGLISSSEGRRSLSDYSAIMKAVDKEREEQIAKYAANFTPGSVRSMMKYGDVVENNNQWIECISVVRSCMETALKHKIKDVQSQVDIVVRLLDDINSRVSKGTMNDMTPETLRTLSAMTLTMAREVEFYALTMYHLSESKRHYEESSKQLIQCMGE